MIDSPKTQRSRTNCSRTFRYSAISASIASASIFRAPCRSNSVKASLDSSGSAVGKLTSFPLRSSMVAYLLLPLGAEWVPRTHPGYAAFSPSSKTTSGYTSRFVAGG